MKLLERKKTKAKKADCVWHKRRLHLRCFCTLFFIHTYIYIANDEFKFVLQNSPYVLLNIENIQILHGLFLCGILCGADLMILLFVVVAVADSVGVLQLIKFMLSDEIQLFSRIMQPFYSILHILSRSFSLFHLMACFTLA